MMLLKCKLFERYRGTPHHRRMTWLVSGLSTLLNFESMTHNNSRKVATSHRHWNFSISRHFFCHFQVVSERLFSTPKSSSSSLTESSDSQGPLQPQEPQHIAHGENRKLTFAKNLKLTFSIVWSEIWVISGCVCWVGSHHYSIRIL